MSWIAVVIQPEARQVGRTESAWDLIEKLVFHVLLTPRTRIECLYQQFVSLICNLKQIIFRLVDSTPLLNSFIREVLFPSLYYFSSSLRDTLSHSQICVMKNIRGIDSPDELFWCSTHGIKLYWFSVNKMNIEQHTNIIVLVQLVTNNLNMKQLVVSYEQHYNQTSHLWH